MLLMVFMIMRRNYGFVEFWKGRKLCDGPAMTSDEG